MTSNESEQGGKAALRGALARRPRRRVKKAPSDWITSQPEVAAPQVLELEDRHSGGSYNHRNPRNIRHRQDTSAAMKMGAISPENPSQLTRNVGKSFDASLEAHERST